MPTFCAKEAQEKIEANTTEEFRAALDAKTRRCYAATTWAECLEAHLLDFAKAQQKKGVASRSFWDYSKIGAHVRKLVRAECEGIEGFDRYFWRGP